MLQINPFLDCTLYSGIVVHIGRNNHKRISRLKRPNTGIVYKKFDKVFSFINS